MPPRFFSPDRRSPARLDGPEAHHLLHVLRAGVGDEVELFDGRGFATAGRVARVGRADAEIAVAGWARRTEREPPGPLEVIAAPPKGKRLDFLLEKATELGMTAFTPLASARTVRSPRERDEPPEAMRRACIEAAKQCGRNVVPEIRPALTVAGAAAEPAAGMARLLCRPGSPGIASGAAKRGPIAGFRLLIGPEGGLTDEEEAVLVAAGWEPVGLAPAILRIETAVIAGLAQAGMP